MPPGRPWQGPLGGMESPLGLLDPSPSRPSPACQEEGPGLSGRAPGGGLQAHGNSGARPGNQRGSAPLSHFPGPHPTRLFHWLNLRRIFQLSGTLTVSTTSRFCESFRQIMQPESGFGAP